ncbi:DNA or RNA helicases of superfamily II [Nostoc sp. NIES-3756]|uniref:DEAD/DEAH box helicase family protein n=1 Tax=Nostoc sp. NIES-3756 TaxID=1751286 RepID=UPI00072173B0|nr:DEAD/DEAH box helicase family protein [Nostoc sp. NIES-3756]BAT55513.1 DNA or RNA helicases of superfamily II [Nostoc sp. NIES-3756]
MPEHNRFLRSKRLRAMLWYNAGGKCPRCGCNLPDDFAADHVIPYSVSKQTNFHQMQALCHKCNREKGAMQLRKHQADMLQICEQIKAGVSNVRTIIVSVTPGGGKSFLPVIAAARLIPTVADAICWIAPRQSLQQQAEEAFADGRLRNFLKHNHLIRSATNEHNPCRGLSGYVTTYQALSADRGTQINAQEFATKRYILFLDEVHHAELDSATHEAIQPLVDRAAVVILGSGTYERGNSQPIAFLPYQKVQGGMTLNLDNLNDPNIGVIRYTRRDALVEKAIIPLHFQLLDCRAEWIDKQGEARTIDSLAEAGDDTGDGLHTALNTEYAFELLRRCLDDWQAHKQVNRRARMLVVAANIANAKRFLEWLKNMNVVAAIATSSDTKEAKKAIERFKTHGKNSVDILVTVAMAYEGLDVPAVTHIACLTHIRSTPWIEQMVTRSARVDRGSGALIYDNQLGYIYAPDDQLFQDCIANIQAEQEPFLKESQERLRNKTGNSGSEQSAFKTINDIIPLMSAATRERASGINGEALDYQETQRLKAAMEGVGCIGISPIQFKKAIEIYQSSLPVGDSYTNAEVNVLIPSTIEDKLKHHIEQHNRKYERRNQISYGTINTKIKRKFGKSRDDMSKEELQRVWGWVQKEYPLEP